MLPAIFPRSCDFTAHMCTGMILSNYKLFVNLLFKLISIEHVIIILSRNIAGNIDTCLSTHISLFLTDGVRTSQQCVCIYTAVYSQTLTAISIFKYNNIVCTIQVHMTASPSYTCNH